MSIEQKLLTIEKNQPKVYKAAVNKYALRKTATGVVAIATKSAEYKPLDFKMDGKTEQNMYTGKNLWNAEYAADPNNWVASTGQSGYLDLPVCVGNNKATVSYKNTLATGLGMYVGVAVKSSESMKAWLYHHTNAGLINKSVTITPEEGYVYIRSVKDAVKDGSFMQYIGNDLQIEIGSTATEYEPYVGSKIKSNLFDNVIREPGGLYNIEGVWSDVPHYNTYYLYNTEGSGPYRCSEYIGGIRTFWDANGNFVSGVSVDTNSTMTFPSGAVLCKFAYHINNQDKEHQIVLGTSLPAYQPYDPTARGIIPAPSPLYPQEIVNAGGDNNLWDAEYASDKNNWVASTGQANYSDLPIYVGAGNEVTVSYKNDLSTGLDIYAGISLGVGEYMKKWIYHASDSSLINRTMTVTSTSDYIYIRCHNDALNNGSFMQYIGNDLQVLTEDLVYKFNFTLLGENILDTTKIQNGYITSTGGVENVTWYRCTDYIYIKGAKTIYISTFITTATSRMVAFYDENYNLITAMYQDANHNVTVPSNAVYTRFNVSPTFAEPIVTINHVPTEYSEYKEPVTFTLSSSVQLTKWDKLINRDGVWGWSICSKEYDLSADEITLDANNPDASKVRVYIMNINGIQNGELECNILKGKTATTQGSYCGFWFNNILCTYMQNEFLEPYGYAYDSTLTRTELIASAKAAFVEMVRAAGGIHVLVDMQEEQSFIPLSDEEQELLNNLTLSYGGCTIYNDQGCPMEIKYVVDPALI